MERDRYECVFCGSPEERRLTVDHLIPVLRGGDNGPDNLACSCKSCNSSKKGRTPEEAGLGFYNAEAEVRYREAAKRIASKLKRYGNGLDKRKSRGEESSVLPNGNTAADAAKLTKDEVWDLGKAMLAKQGVGPKIAGSYIGHLIKSHGEAQVLGALRRAIGEQPADLREWLKGALRHKVAKANARAAVAQQIYGAAKKDEPAEPIDITGEARRVA